MTETDTAERGLADGIDAAIVHRHTGVIAG